MNTCPSCSGKPISLGGWCNGLNSINCKCKSCGIELSANVATWIILAIIVITMCLTAYISITQYDVHFKQDRLLLIGLVSLPVLIGSVVGYFVGGYRVKE